MGLLGAMAGGGIAINDVADRRLKAIGDQELLTMRDQMEQAREKRIEEAAIRSEGRHEQAAIRQESRALENRKIQQSNDLDFETNPDNVQRKAGAFVEGQKVKDQYTDSRFDTELGQSVRKAKALHEATDTTDYYGRSLAHQAAELEIEQSRKGLKLPAAVKEQVAAWKDEAKELSREISSGALEGKALLAAQDELRSVRQNITSTLSKYSPEGTGVDQTDDPVAKAFMIDGIETKYGKLIEGYGNSPRPDLNNLSIDQLKQFEEELKTQFGDKPDESKKPKQTESVDKRNLIDQIIDATGDRFDYADLKGLSIEELETFLAQHSEKTKSSESAGSDEKWVKAGAKSLFRYGQKKVDDWKKLTSDEPALPYYKNQ